MLKRWQNSPLIITGGSVDTVKAPEIQVAWQGDDHRCANCGIRHLALFADLQRNDFDLIHQPIDDLSYGVGEVVYHMGSQANHLFTVRAGLVKLTQTLPCGTQRIVRLLRQGDIIGLEALVDHDYQHTATTLQPSKLCRIPVAVIDKLSTETPRMHKQLMQRWQRALEDADQWLTELSTGHARSRVARLLLLQAEVEKEEGFELLGREDLGAVLGITTETASRMIAEFRRNGLLVRQENGRFQADIDELQAMADS